MMKHLQVTFITTIKNEENSILKFLESIGSQTRKPDEIIIVDAGSTDATESLISKFKFQIPNEKIKLIKKKGNRSVGRNTAIKNSTHEIIVCTDAGCILDKNWLKRISEPFKNESIDVVAGFYKPKANSIFEKCLATYTCVMPDKITNSNFLPSSRSVAFRKSAWTKVGGYPEYLDTCEDLVFAKKMKNTGLIFRTVKEAVVYWPQRKNIFQAARQFFSYARGDGKARYIRNSTPFLFGRYIIGISFFIYIFISKNFYLLTSIYFLLFAYILWAIYKNYKYVKNWKAFFYLPLLQFVSDIAVISGTIIGIGQSIWDTQDK